MGWDSVKPRQPAYVWKTTDQFVYELPVRNFAHVFTWIEVREYPDGSTTVKELQFPKRRGIDL
jgi:hypothetical protein